MQGFVVILGRPLVSSVARLLVRHVVFVLLVLKQIKELVL
jgi:hypothetical protein